MVTVVSRNLVTARSLSPSPLRNLVTVVSFDYWFRNFVTVVSFYWLLKNLVTVISFSSRNLLTSLSLRRKLARAVSKNFVTVISFASRKREVAESKNSMTVSSRYFVTGASSVSRKVVIKVSSRYFAIAS